MQTSPDLIPVNRYSSSIAQIWRETNGRAASTSASGTGLTDLLSGVADRPRPSPLTALSPWWTLAGTRSFSTAYWNALLIRPMRWLIVRRQRPELITFWRTVFSAFGPKSLAGVLPCRIFKRPQGELDVVQLPRRCPVGAAVEVARMPVVGQDHLVDGRPCGFGGLGGARVKGGPRGQAFEADPIVLLPALGRVVFAEVDVPAVEPDDGEILRLVVAVLGKTPRVSGHGAALSS